MKPASPEIEMRKRAENGGNKWSGSVQSVAEEEWHWSWRVVHKKRPPCSSTIKDWTIFLRDRPDTKTLAGQ